MKNRATLDRMPPLHLAVQALSDREFRAVLLRFWEERPICEVAACLRISWKRADEMLNQAISKLRERLLLGERACDRYAVEFAAAGHMVASRSFRRDVVDRRIQSLGQRVKVERSDFLGVEIKPLQIRSPQKSA